MPTASPADFLSGGQIPIHQGRGHLRARPRCCRTHSSHRLGKKSGDVHVQMEQIANDVLILRTIQAVDRFGAARIGMGSHGPIELAFGPRGEAVQRGGVRARSSGRGHEARTDLAR